MRVAFFIRVLVMHPMYGDKEDRAALQGKRAADSENILHPFRCLVPSVRQEPMVSHPDPDAAGDPPQNHRNQKCFPGEKEESDDSTDVKGDHEESRYPNYRLS